MDMTMKRAILFGLCLSLFTPAILAWGGLGHATVAKVAYDHLTPEARVIIKECLDGMTIVSVASDADTYRSVWQMDLGFVPTNPDDARVKWLKEFDFSTPENISPWSHSFTVDEKGEPYLTDNLNGRYINNILYYTAKLSKQLKENAMNMDREERKRAISLIVHFLGDMHCPMHIVFPDGPLKGNFKVKYKGKETTYHSFWDSGIMNQDAPWSFSDLAFLVDTASPTEIAAICQGDIYDYGRSSARDSWAIAVKYKENDTIPGRFPAEMRSLLYSQLRNAGYRLAAILNDIFSDVM